jgi:tetratricopeptide (TPR) repeat protein
VRTAFLAAILVVLMATVAAAQALPPFSTARLYVREADFAAAIRPYQQAIAANARNAQAQYWLGYAYVYAYRQWLAGAAPYASGYLARAVPPLQEAIKLEPGMIAAYLALHDAYHLGGQHDQAADLFAQMYAKTRPGWLAPVPVR